MAGAASSGANYILEYIEVPLRHLVRHSPFGSLALMFPGQLHPATFLTVLVPSIPVETRKTLASVDVAQQLRRRNIWPRHVNVLW